MQIAEALHMSLSDVRAMPASEITDWLAYFKIKNKPEDKKEDTVTQFKKMMGQK